MARIDIKSGGTILNDGILQLENGVAMDATLRNVADQNNTTSPLKLSTTAVQVVSPLRVTTDDPSDMYLDLEDGSANNRFNITRNTASQQVNLNFASNPGGSTTVVGAIRTYVDGVNLSEVMTFREDGNVGIGTTTPTTKLHVSSGALTTAIIDGAGRVNMSFVNSGTTMGVIGGAVAVTGGAQNDFGIGTNGTSNNLVFGTGTSYSERMRIQPGGNVGIGETSPTAKLSIKGSGSTSATTSLLVQNSGGTTLLRQTDDGNLRLYTGTFSPYAYTSDGGFNIASGGNFSLSHNGGINSVFFSSYYYTGDIYAKYAVAIGNISVGFINASAQLQVDSTTKGFLPPRMTNAQRAAIAAPAVGLMVYCTDAVEGLYIYKSTGWTFVI